MTNKIKSIVYGLGGFDPSKENNNIIEIIEYTPEELESVKIQENAEQTKADILAKLGLSQAEIDALLSQ